MRARCRTAGRHRFVTLALASRLSVRYRLDECSRCDNLGWAKPARVAAALASPDLSATYQR